MMVLFLKQRLTEERKRFLNLAALAGFGACLSSLVFLTGCATSNATATSKNVQGVESFSAGNYDEAIAFFQDSINENPNSAEAYYNLGSAYQRKANQTKNLNLLTQAEDAYWQALQLSPAPETIVCCYRGIATSATARGDSAGAMRTLEEWRDRNPDSIEPQLEIAYLLEAQGRDDDAYELLEQIAEAAPNDYRAYYKMGVLAEHAENFSTAVEQTRVAAQLQPSNADMSRRVRALENQYAATQRRQQAEEANAQARQNTNNELMANSTPVTVQTTKVQSTSAQGESEAIPEMILPPDDATPVQSAPAAPTTGTNDSAAAPQYGFGEVVLFSADSPEGKLVKTEPTGSATVARANTTRFTKTDENSTADAPKSDDSDVKWISATAKPAEKVAQTSAVAPKTQSASQNAAPVKDLATTAKKAEPEKKAQNNGENVEPRSQDNTRYKEPTAKREKAPREIGAGMPRMKAGSFF